MRLLLTLTVSTGLAVAVFAGVSGARNGGGLCRGSVLTGAFKAVPGSAGAGNIVYRLTVKNGASVECGITGLPTLKLLGKTGKKLPTSTTFNGMPGAMTAVLVHLRPAGPPRSPRASRPTCPGSASSTRGRAKRRRTSCA